MNKDVKTISRTVFNFFELLGTVGGFYGLFVSISTIILGFVNYNKKDNSLISDLFTVRVPSKNAELQSNIDDKPPERQINYA